MSSSEDILRSQIVTLEKGRGKHRKYLPYVFTEQGVSMLSAILKSQTAIDVSIRIINTFVQMRKFISQNALLFQRLDNLEQRQFQIGASLKDLDKKWFAFSKFDKGALEVLERLA